MTSAKKHKGVRRKAARKTDATRLRPVARKKREGPRNLEQRAAWFRARTDGSKRS